VYRTYRGDPIEEQVIFGSHITLKVLSFKLGPTKWLKYCTLAGAGGIKEECLPLGKIHCVGWCVCWYATPCISTSYRQRKASKHSVDPHAHLRLKIYLRNSLLVVEIKLLQKYRL
jgi:hypothetical protein